MKNSKIQKGLIHLFFIFVLLLYVLPLLLIVSISFSSEGSITSANAGYHLIPQVFSAEGYKLAFRNPDAMVRAYLVTGAQAVLGTLLSCLIIGMIAYPLSRRSFAYKRYITFIVFFTMLFSGGLISTYIVYTRLYGLSNSFWVYILPGLSGGAWYTLVVRTFFKGLPEALFESAKIDGLREFSIFWKIAMPLSKPVFATIGFMMLVAKWNDWDTSLIYIRDPELYTLQYMLQRILNEVQFLRDAVNNPGMANINLQTSFPAETLKYAMCVIAAGPMLVIFPFFQKYFSKGLTIGAVKG